MDPVNKEPEAATPAVGAVVATVPAARLEALVQENALLKRRLASRRRLGKHHAQGAVDFRARNEAARAGRCVLCRCTDDDACVFDLFPCAWVLPGLCSACVASLLGVPHEPGRIPPAFRVLRDFLAAPARRRRARS